MWTSTQTGQYVHGGQSNQTDRLVKLFTQNHKTLYSGNFIFDLLDISPGHISYILSCFKNKGFINVTLQMFH